MEEKNTTKRIAKNTLMLYFRQILIMIVSLYTVRVVLNTLGAEDYGIYNVVAGVVVLFSFVNNAMATSTQRFLNFNLGKEDTEKTQQTYSSSLLIHIGIALIFVILAETVGLWFVNTKLNIPLERHCSAMWCYQFSIITTVFNILRVPYNAVIIAYEKMSFFAWVSIVEAVLKLLVVYLLIISPFDKLVAYVILLTLVSIIILFCYKIYCNKKFEIAHYKKVTDYSLVKEILGFSGWSLFGATANVANSQGTNIVLNMFTNVTVNAAMGIANQVNSAVYSFVSNFQTAFNPQIIKSYAAKNYDYFNNLICRTSKFSFLLLTYIALPLYVNVDFVLTLWLKNVPQYSCDFVNLILLFSLIDAFNGPLWMAAQAPGKIKNYQLVVSFFIFLNLPLSILVMYLGVSPLYVLYIRIILNICITFYRLLYLKKHVGLSIISYFKSVFFPCVLVLIVSFISVNFIGAFFDGVVRFLITCISSVFINTLLVFIFCLSKDELMIIKRFLFNKDLS